LTRPKAPLIDRWIEAKAGLVTFNPRMAAFVIVRASQTSLLVHIVLPYSECKSEVGIDVRGDQPTGRFVDVTASGSFHGPCIAGLCEMS